MTTTELDIAIADAEAKIARAIAYAAHKHERIGDGYWHDLYHLRSQRRLAARLLPLLTAALREEGIAT